MSWNIKLADAAANLRESSFKATCSFDCERNRSQFQTPLALDAWRPVGPSTLQPVSAIKWTAMLSSPNHKLASALNSVSFNSPSSKSLKDVASKSSRKPACITSTIASSNHGATKKRNGSPIKLFNVRDRVSSSHEDLTGPIILESGYRASCSTKSSPVKQGSAYGGGSKNGLNSAGGGLGRMDVVSNDWDARDPRSESTKRSPSKKGKNVSPLSSSNQKNVIQLK